MKNYIYYALGLLFFTVGVFAFLHNPTPALALTVPEGFQVRTIAGGMTYPTSMTIAPDGRIFVAEKAGSVRVIEDGELLPTPLITLPDVNTFTDRGLLGIAVDPNFEDNGYLYLSYTHENSPEDFEGPKVGRIIRVTVTGNTADLSTREIVLGSVGGSPENPSCSDFAITADCIFSDSPSHSVGGLRFGPDGKLYAALGDGAHFAYVDPEAENALDLDALAGKILRINTDGTAPSDNPFYNGDPNANRSKVWSYGLRNPYRFNFRPSDGELFLADVGWGEAEEVNTDARGANYGWPCREGYGVTAYDCTTENYTDPIYTYPHEDGVGSITGGAFPADGAYPEEYMSSYYFGDYSLGFIRQMKLDEDGNVEYVEEFAQEAGGPVDIVTGPDGTIYYVDIYNGQVRNIVYSTDNQSPDASIGASPTAGLAPLTVSFTGEDSTDPDGDELSYYWDFGDGSAPSDEINPAHVYAEDGTYTATLTVRDGAGNSDSISATITVGVESPNDADPHHEGTTISPLNPNIGNEITITTSVSNAGESDPLIVDIEIYDEGGEQVSQRIFENVVIESGQEDEYSYTWFPPTPGTYTVSVGLFESNWSGLYEWSSDVHTIEVRNRVPDTEDFDPEHVATTASPQNVTTGEVSTITAEVENSGGEGSMLVDIEVLRNGEKIAQEFYNNEFFEAGETREFELDWEAAEPGEYTVSIGLFDVDWAETLSWISDAASITVEGDSGEAEVMVYSDGLGEGWANWSWGTDVDFNSTEVVSEGSSAARIGFRSSWAGFYLHHDGLDVDSGNSLNFAVSGGSSGGQALKVFLYDAAGNALPARSLSEYTSEATLPSNEWIEVAIPLTDLGIEAGTVTGIAIQGRDGSVQPTFYIDEVSID